MSSENKVGINFVEHGVDALNSKLKSFKQNMTNTDKASKGATGALGKFQAETKKLNNRFTNINKDMNSTNNSLGKMAKGFNSMLGVAKIYAMSSAMATMVQSSLDAIETQNLFNVAMGDTVKQTQAFVDSMHDAFGFDITNIQSATSSYGLLARSMGMTSTQANILGTNTYKLGVDLASLTNVPINQVMQDLRSGLIGQTETVYKYGVDLTEASLAQEALVEGIGKSVREMTQGEKMALRYNLLIKQTALAHGDFANTIMTPANQLKILSERFVTLGRSIGNAFIPMLSATLPYINAFVLALTEIMNAIAQFFGYKPDTSGGSAGLKNNLSDVTGSAEDASGALDKATDSAKKLNDQTLGMDELHMITPKTDSASKDAGAGAGSMLGEMDLSRYDNLMSKLNDTSKILAEKIKPALEFILKLIGEIALGFLSWKLANGIIGALTSPALAKALTSLKGLATGAGLSAFFGSSTAIIAGLASTIFIMVARFIDLVATNENFRRGLETIWGWMKAIVGWVTSIGAPAIGKFLWDLIPKDTQDELLALGKWLKDLGFDFKDLGIIVVGLGMLLVPALAPFGTALLVFEGLTIAVRLLGEAMSPAVEQTATFGDEISKATKDKLQPFLDKCNGLTEVFTRMEFTGEIVNQQTVDDVKTKIGAITQTILSELDADKNENLKNLQPLKGLMSTEMYNSLLASTDDYYAKATQKVQDNENQINNIMATAKAQNRALTESELAQIRQLEDSSQKQGLQSISENAIEYESILRTLKDNSVALSVEQASEIITNSKKTHDETVKNAESQYSKIKLEADKMLEVGAINKDQYDAMISSAELAKDSTIKSADTQYQTIVENSKAKLGELASNIDYDTGQIKTKWDVFTSNLSSSYKKSCKDINDAYFTFVNDFKKGWEDFWKGVNNTTARAVNTGLDAFEAFANGFIDAWNKVILAYNEAKSAMGISGWTPAIPHISIARIPMLARGGVLDSGSMFVAGELGKAEAIGSYKGKTTVMPLENTDFVQSMYDAVYSAMQSVDLSGQVVDNAIYLDGEVIYKNQQKIQRNRGVDFGMGVFAR